VLDIVTQQQSIPPPERRLSVDHAGIGLIIEMRALHERIGDRWAAARAGQLIDPEEILAQLRITLSVEFCDMSARTTLRLAEIRGRLQRIERASTGSCGRRERLAVAKNDRPK
jgi:hypothetical protein